MLRLYRRHRTSCPHASERYRRCNCPIYVEGTLAGERVRQALDLTSWTAAMDVIAQWNEAGEIGALREVIPTITEAITKYFEDAAARSLRPATIAKHRNLLERRLQVWCDDQGYRQLKQLTPDALRQFRATWPDAALSAAKNLERLRTFFRFCHQAGWVKSNAALAVKPPKVRLRPTLSFSNEEFARLVAACDQYPVKGVHREGNRLRLKAMVLLLRYSGLRIRDAVTLPRDHVRDGRLFLYTQKTGQPVSLPLPPTVVAALEAVPRIGSAYYFWSGEGDAKSAVADWQRSFRKLCSLADVANGHFHRFRDTAAVGWLAAGLSVEEVAALLGNSPHVVIKHYSPWVLHGTSLDLASFEATLPPALVEWFREMFRYARESRDAMKVVKTLLDENGPFGSASSFQHRGAADFFLRLTDAAPELALRRMQAAFEGWNAEDFRRFVEGRRQVVWALERIAVWNSLFAGAARLLLRLAEGENEQIANSATGVFADLFSPGQGPVAPTEASPADRFPVLKEALEHPSEGCRQVALLACDHALETGHFTRLVGAEHQGLRQPPQLWMPKTWGELFDAYRRVWHLLRQRLHHLPEHERQKAVGVMLRNVRGLSQMANLVGMVIDTLLEFSKDPTIDRRELVRVVEHVIHYDGRSFEPAIRDQWEQLRNSLVPGDFHSLMLRFVALDLVEDKFDEAGNHTDKVQPHVGALARQAVDAPGLIQPELGWLTTDGAKNGFAFGVALGTQDVTGSLLPAILDAQRNAGNRSNVFFLGGYLRAMREREVSAWEDLMDRLADDPALRGHVPELTWRSGLTERAALRILTLAQAGVVEVTHFRLSSYGGVVRQLSEGVFARWIDFLLTINTRLAASCAVDLCHFYYLMREPKVAMAEELVFRVLTAAPLFALSQESDSSTTEDYDWTELAAAFIRQWPHRSVELASMMLGHFRESGTIVGAFHSQTNRGRTQVLELFPGELWEQIASRLGPPIDSRAFHIYHWLRDGALALVPPSSVWRWVEADVERRAWYLGQFVPPVFQRNDGAVSAREVLVRYGSREDVRRSLAANFSTEMWSGPESGHLQRKLEQFEGWKRGETDTNVLRWLEDYTESLRRRVEQAKIGEEREG